MQQPERSCRRVGLDVRLPVGKPRQNVLQALSARSVLDIAVARSMCTVGVVVIQQGRRNVVGTTPSQDFSSPYSSRISDLFLPLGGAVVMTSLDWAPGALDGNPQTVCCIQWVCGVRCATLQGGVNNIQEDVALC